MNLIRFKKGYNNWEITYEVELDFEYTPDLKKRITSVIFYRPDIEHRISIPWRIFRAYLDGDVKTAFANSSGLSIRVINGEIHISAPEFNLLIHRDQAIAIRNAAKNLVENVSVSVENIFRKSAMQCHS